MLLKSSRASNLPGESERASYRDRIYRELPCFVDFLLNEFQIPQELKCPHGRYGVTHFHHPDILNAIQELSPESKLHDILQSVLFTSPVENKWEGRALDLERKLRDSGQGYESSKILTFPNACGTYLGKLKKKYEGKELYTRRIIHGTTYWTIRGQP